MLTISIHGYPQILLLVNVRLLVFSKSSCSASLQLHSAMEYVLELIVYIWIPFDSHYCLNSFDKNSSSIDTPGNLDFPSSCFSLYQSFDFFFKFKRFKLVFKEVYLPLST